MTSRDFCYWLQGFFEIAHGDASGTVDAVQADCIRKHLALVFKHEIDPSAGPPAHQDALNAIHAGDGKPSSQAQTTAVRPQIGGVDPLTGITFRC